jgi:excisionase family DNA binding protein
MAQNLIGAAEAAHILNRDRVTVLRWAKAGRLSCTRLHARGAYMFDRTEVEQLRERIDVAAALTDALPFGVPAVAS